MRLLKRLFTNNDCYKAGKYITPKGIMVHSTGCENPTLKRYVHYISDDDPIGKNLYNNHWNRPLPDKKQKCVHAFIGKLQDGSIATAQTLPWDMRGWHCNGSANNTHISFEMCEDNLTDKTYFRTVWKEATELCAYLCTMYKLDPMKDGVIIGHYEGNKRGIASNHADPEHWFKKHNKTMDDFRRDVNSIMMVKTDLNEYEQWAVDNKLFVGDGKGNYNFDKAPTRSELATVLKRFYDMFIK